MADPQTGVEAGVALVTGAAHRIGRAIALDLAKAGWGVAIHYKDSKDAAEAVAREIEGAGHRADAVRADLADPDEAEGLIAQVSAAIGPVSCLINNASLFEKDALHSATARSWDAHFDINLRAPMLLIQSFAAGLPEGIEGNVINVLDQRVWNLTPHFLSYTVSKAGLWTLTQTAALALAPRIRVNGIGPGPTLPSSRQSEADFEGQVVALPLGRGPQVEEICATVRFILAAKSMTGQMIALDGGQHLSWAPAGAGPSRE